MLQAKEYVKPSSLEDIVSRCHNLGVKIVDLEITKKRDESGNAAALLALLSRQGAGREEIIRELSSVEGVVSVMRA